MTGHKLKPTKWYKWDRMRHAPVRCAHPFFKAVCTGTPLIPSHRPPPLLNLSLYGYLPKTLIIARYTYIVEKIGENPLDRDRVGNYSYVNRSWWIGMAGEIIYQMFSCHHLTSTCCLNITYYSLHESIGNCFSPGAMYFIFCRLYTTTVFVISLFLKGSLTRDFRLQVFFINQCPPDP
jgi:hypothetical protein